MNDLTLLNILKKRNVHVVLLCLFLLPTFMLINYNMIGNQIIESNQNRKSSILTTTQEELSINNGYQLVDPINISSGSDWTLYPFITGNGSVSNPYIIENVEIIGDGIRTTQSGNDTFLDTSYVGIYINAGGSFIIRNCKISHTSIGIHLYVNIPPGSYPISNVEISDCSIGIYSRWTQVGVNISNCHVHDCNWISIDARIDFNSFLDYGGVGIWVRSSEGGIENCRIEDCSIGMVAGQIQVNRYNEFKNCGFVPDWLWMYVTDYDKTNTVNGKPIGIFWGINNWVFTNASLYGQLIFASCSNLTLSNIHFTEPCSIPIQLISLGVNQTTYLNNIIVENQKLGMYISGRNMFGDNLYAKNCEAGFYFNYIEDSEFTRVMTDNTKVPIYMTSPTDNFTIEIEKSTKFYLADYNAWYGDILQITPGDDVSTSYITELGMPGFDIQNNNYGTYRYNLTLIRPAPHDIFTYSSRANFTVISVPRYPRPDISMTIRDYPYFLIWSVVIIGLLLFLEFSRRFYQK